MIKSEVDPKSMAFDISRLLHTPLSLIFNLVINYLINYLINSEPWHQLFGSKWRFMLGFEWRFMVGSIGARLVALFIISVIFT